jgi:hypothetical protein
MKPTSRKNEGSLLARVIANLATKEDPLHLHKSLGTACLASFLWRFSYIRDPSADLGFVYFPQFTFITILLHLFLNLSSFEFNLPEKRISSGYRIWPEYRLHSLVFLIRSLLLMTIYWHESVFDIEPNYWLNGLVVLGSMAAADLASATCKHQSSTIRALQAPNIVKYYFSVMQFCATATCLYGLRRFTVQFYFVMIIQCNAFLMTLRRKNLMLHQVGVVLYGIGLVLGLTLAIVEYDRAGGLDCVRSVTLVACSAAFWRMGPWSERYKNKYLIWAVECLFLNLIIRPSLESDYPLLRSQLGRLADASMLLVVLYGIFTSLPNERKRMVK